MPVSMPKNASWPASLRVGWLPPVTELKTTPAGVPGAGSPSRAMSVLLRQMPRSLVESTVPPVWRVARNAACPASLIAGWLTKSKRTPGLVPGAGSPVLKMVSLRACAGSAQAATMSAAAVNVRILVVADMDIPSLYYSQICRLGKGVRPRTTGSQATALQEFESHQSPAYLSRIVILA